MSLVIDDWALGEYRQRGTTGPSQHGARHRTGHAHVWLRENLDLQLEVGPSGATVPFGVLAHLLARRGIEVTEPVRDARPSPELRRKVAFWIEQEGLDDALRVDAGPHDIDADTLDPELAQDWRDYERAAGRIERLVGIREGD